MLFLSPKGITAGGLCKIDVAGISQSHDKEHTLPAAARPGCGNSIRGREAIMFNRVEIKLSAEMVERKGGRLLTVYVGRKRVALVGLIKGEDGRRNTLLKIPKERKKGAASHTNCFVS